MPARESEALILRSFPLGEGDRLVSFLSRSEGRLRGVATGARKPKSRFGSTLELFSHVRMWYYERETRELVRINQCELIESFLDAQRDYAAGVTLALMSETTEAVLGEREVAERMFRLLLVAARAIKAGAKLPLALAYFALLDRAAGRLDAGARSVFALRRKLNRPGIHEPERGAVLPSSARIRGSGPISKDALQLARRHERREAGGLDEGRPACEGRG